MSINERQKPFSKIGRLNAEIITRKHFCGGPAAYANVRCECGYCEGKRRALKRQVNKLMGHKFYEDV